MRSTYGNLALLNSTSMKYSTASMAHPPKASASHVSCLIVITHTSTFMMPLADRPIAERGHHWPQPLTAFGDVLRPAG